LGPSKVPFFAPLTPHFPTVYCQVYCQPDSCGRQHGLCAWRRPHAAKSRPARFRWQSTLRTTANTPASWATTAGNTARSTPTLRTSDGRSGLRPAADSATPPTRGGGRSARLPRQPTGRRSVVAGKGGWRQPANRAVPPGSINMAACTIDGDRPDPRIGVTWGSRHRAGHGLSANRPRAGRGRATAACSTATNRAS